MRNLLPFISWLKNHVLVRSYKYWQNPNTTLGMFGFHGWIFRSSDDVRDCRISRTNYRAGPIWEKEIILVWPDRQREVGLSCWIRQGIQPVYEQVVSRVREREWQVNICGQHTSEAEHVRTVILTENVHVTLLLSSMFCHFIFKKTYQVSRGDTLAIYKWVKLREWRGDIRLVQGGTVCAGSGRGPEPMLLVSPCFWVLCSSSPIPSVVCCWFYK